MDASQYWVGQIPKRPLAIDVRDSMGRETNLSAYSTFKAKIVGTGNEEIDITGSELQTAGANVGRFIFVWPSDRSLFTKPGEYLFQLELSDSTSKDFTTTWPILVREAGED